ncbi:MAG: DUF1330 domain-containing protein [Proteobacteria bacterium]|nr:DUF1330 domain-containing protein [Pseudomonadota bacterium]
MPAYVIGNITVTDPSWVEKYVPAVAKIVEKYGGKYIVNTPEVDVLEGGPAPSVTVVLEFPTVEQAKKWYDSDDYAPWIEARKSGSHGDLFLVDGR